MRPSTRIRRYDCPCGFHLVDDSDDGEDFRASVEEHEESHRNLPADEMLLAFHQAVQAVAECPHVPLVDCTEAAGACVTCVARSIGEAIEQEHRRIKAAVLQAMTLPGVERDASKALSSLCRALEEVLL